LARKLGISSLQLSWKFGLGEKKGEDGRRRGSILHFGQDIFASFLRYEMFDPTDD